LLSYNFFPQVFDFFDSRLVEYFLDPDVVSRDLEDADSSGGNRAYLLKAVIDFTSHNPLTGAGYLGVWVAFGDQSGSAHNQYLDVLFRTGFPGFLAYCYLLYVIGRFLYRNERGLFWGFVSILSYGIFHETFKESHGTFVLAFFLGMMSKKQHQRCVPQKDIAALSPVG
jgi:O-antigen ligase